MGHNLFNKQMAWVGSAPWHGLGIRVPPTITASDMITAAGLEWIVRKQPANGARFDMKRGSYDRYLLLRDPVLDEKSAVALGMVGPGYEILQNTEAFSFFQPFIEKGYARYESAGALGNGERVWVLAKLRNSITITDSDQVERYLLLSNSHDGRGAVNVRFTPIRVVCQNTLNFALEGGRGSVSVRHTKNISSNLLRDQADKLHLLTEKVYADARLVFQSMVNRQISPETKVAYLDALFPRTEKQRQAHQLPVRWQRVESILTDERVTPPETSGTLWALYNAVTRDEDYRASREGDPSSRLDRVWFGSGEALKVRALTEARRLIAA